MTLCLNPKKGLWVSKASWEEDLTNAYRVYIYKHAHTNGYVTGGSKADGIITALFEPPELRNSKTFEQTHFQI